MDDADRASDTEAFFRDAAIAAARGVPGPAKGSPATCKECGREIEDLRRQLIVGTPYCFFCADEIERRLRLAT